MLNLLQFLAIFIVASAFRVPISLKRQPKGKITSHLTIEDPRWDGFYSAAGTLSLEKTILPGESLRILLL
jgi:hypothetical protein